MTDSTPDAIPLDRAIDPEDALAYAKALLIKNGFHTASVDGALGGLNTDGTPSVGPPSNVNDYKELIAGSAQAEWFEESLEEAGLEGG